MERNKMLEDAIHEYIQKNPNMDSVDIAIHFKLRADITLDSLSKLIDDKKVIRHNLFGARYGYICT